MAHLTVLVDESKLNWSQSPEDGENDLLDPRVELIYFPGRGRSELVRLLLVEAGVNYKERLLDTPESWSLLKESGESPYHQAPIVNIDGVSLCQTRAIQNFLAAKYDLKGSNLIEAAQAEAVVEAVADLNDKSPFMQIISGAHDAEKRKIDFFEKWIPKYFGIWESQLKKAGGSFFIGGKISIADLAVWNYLRTFHEFEEDCAYGAAGVLSSYPTLTKFFHDIKQRPRIAEYLVSPKCYKNPPPPEYFMLVGRVLGW